MKNKKHPLASFLIGFIGICSILSQFSDINAIGFDCIQGDFNSDGKVSIADAVFLMRYIAEDSTLEIPTQTAFDPDLNTDGLLSILDVQFFLRHHFDQTIVTKPPQTDNTSETTTLTTTTNLPIESDYLLNLRTLPPYQQMPYVTVNQNLPYFSAASNETTAFEYYSPLDDLGRCGYCEACIGQELMPTEKRGSIGMVKPSGWQLVRYDGIVDGNYLFNRCHLIGYQLTGENANVCNLITGTRYLNVTGMLPFENQTADYIKSTGNHVRYRVTPYFENQNLVATGVLMEAQSVEDSGSGLQFNVFCYNVQPQIFIDYATGANHLIDTADQKNEDTTNLISDYVVNKNTKKFHYPSCSSVADIKVTNRWDYSGTRDSLIEQGYTPCQRCNP